MKPTRYSIDSYLSIFDMGFGHKTPTSGVFYRIMRRQAGSVARDVRGVLNPVADRVLADDRQAQLTMKVVAFGTVPTVSGENPTINMVM